jgi:hypothetical protein
LCDANTTINLSKWRFSSKIKLFWIPPERHCPT